MTKRADFLEKSIDKVMSSHHLSKAFEQAPVTHPFDGTTRRLWRPKKDIVQQYYSPGERIIVAILLDTFHEEYGLSDYINEPSLDEALEKNERVAELIWPGISMFRELSLLDLRLANIVSELLID